MPAFIIDAVAQENGDREIHNRAINCPSMPAPNNQISLGVHTNCFGAVAQATMDWPEHQINGCDFCCNQGHAS
jgi:hypothetical protein